MSHDYDDGTIASVRAKEASERESGVAKDVVHPSHYSQLKPEPIDVIAAWSLNFNLGNVLKYVARAGNKGSAAEDLKKAAKYLQHEITRLSGIG